VEIGKAVLRRAGADVSLIGISWMAAEAVRAAERLAADGIDAEVIDLRSLKPWDQHLVLASVRKTGAVVVADTGWRTAGAPAEIAATISAEAFHDLRAPIERVTLPDAPAPTSREEERAYYPGADDIYAAARRVLGYRKSKEAA
jgi:pyruvate dehydrogenase E1 component beta subunit